MNVLNSNFIKLASKGAITLSITDEEITIKDSTFLSCTNNDSGGAVHITSKNSKHEIQRCCGTLCYTLKVSNYLDYGQFLFINSPDGESDQESLSVDRCVDRLITSWHNGPITNAGDASHSCSNSNISNCYCRLGGGFCIADAHNAKLSFMNFANDTSDLDLTEYSGYFIAAVFHRSDGEVSKSNFIECKNIQKGTGDPPGNYISCAFVNCVNYNTNFINKHFSQALDISFPLSCPARGKIETRRCFCQERLSFFRALCLIQSEKIAYLVN